MFQNILPLTSWWTRLRSAAALARRKPQLVLRIGLHALHNLLFRSSRLRSVDISVTSLCNFRCTHCYAESFVHEEPVPLEVLGRAIREAHRLGAFHFVLQGGEAIVDFDRLRTIIALTSPHRSYLTLVSNGWAMTPDRIAELKRLGIDKITVSLDSGIAEEHDRNRNRPGSYDRAVRALSHIVQAGLHTAISTVVTHKNLHSEGMQTLFRFARENRYRIDVQVAQPVGMWEGRMDLLIDQEDAAYLRALRDPSQTNLNGQVLVNRDLYPTLCREGCPAVKEFLSITTKGEVLPCTFIQISLGNIRNRSLKEMRAAALRNEYFALYNPTCLSGEDRGFIDRYLARVWGQDKPGDGTRIFAGDRPTQASSPPNEDADRRTVSSR